MKHEYANHTDCNNEEMGIQLAPHMSKISLITQLKESNRTNRELQTSLFQERPLVYTSESKLMSKVEEINPFSDKLLKLSTQILIFRFSNKLRRKSGNVAINSVQSKYLRLLRDMGSDENSFSYKGQTVQRVRNTHSSSSTKSSILGQQFIRLYSKVPILMPSSRLNIFLDVIILILTLIQLIIVPLQLTFDMKFELLNIMQLVFYSFFTMDCFRSIITGIYLDGNLVLERFTILRYYIFHNLWMDTLTVYSFWFLLQNEIGQLLFLLRFQKVNQTLTKLEIAVNLEYQNYITLAKSIFLMLFGTHIMSCFMNLIQNITDSEWLSINPVEDKTLLNVYIHSLYWAVQTMVSVGYGDILPQTNIQKIYSSLIMFIGCCLFGYMMNSIGNILYLINENKRNYSRYKKIHDCYFCKKPISPELLHRIQIYLEHAYQYQQSSAIQGSEILNLISEELKFEFTEQVNGRIVQRNTFFNQFSGELVQQVTHQLYENSFLPSDQIDSNTNSLLILDTGQIYLQSYSVVVERYKTQFQNINLYSFVTNLIKEGQYYSKTHSSVYIMKREDFYKILQSYEEDFDLFSYYKDEATFKKNCKFIKLFCSVCSSCNHQIFDCPQIHFIPNKVKIMFQKESTPNSRFYMPRMREKSNTLRRLLHHQAGFLIFYQDHYSELMTYMQNYDHQLSQPEEPKISFRLLSQEHLISRDQLNNAFSNESNLQIQTTSKMLTFQKQNSTPLTSEKTIYNSLDDLDLMCDYKHYYPECNVKEVIKTINRMRKRINPQAQSCLRQSLFRNSALTLKRMGSNELRSRRRDIQERKLQKLSTPSSIAPTPISQFQKRTIISNSTIKPIIFKGEIDDSLKKSVQLQYS